MENPEIFISYAWGGDSENIVNELDKAFQDKGITLIRDKRDLGFKGMITDFMNQIGAGKAVVVVISDKYLRSPYCMYELLEIYRNLKFQERIFPIVLGDAKIFEPMQRLEYLNYWKQKKAELDAAVAQHGTDAFTVIGSDWEVYRKIMNNFGEISNILKDINSLTPQMHRESGFKELIKAVEIQTANRIAGVPVKSKKVFYTGAFVLIGVLLVVVFFFVFRDPSGTSTTDTIKDSTDIVDSTKWRDTSVEAVSKPGQLKTQVDNSYKASNSNIENLTVSASTNKGTSPVFKAKDEIQISYKINKPAYLRVLYRMADNSVILLLDNLKVDADKLNSWQTIPLTFLCSEPFGEEKLLVYAQTTKFEALSTTAYGQYTLVTNNWEQILSLSEKGLVTKQELGKYELNILTKAE